MKKRFFRSAIAIVFGVFAQSALAFASSPTLNPPGGNVGPTFTNVTILETICTEDGGNGCGQPDNVLTIGSGNVLKWMNLETIISGSTTIRNYIENVVNEYLENTEIDDSAIENYINNNQNVFVDIIRNATGVWEKGSGNDIYYNKSGGKVGIGKATPAEALDVNGNILASGSICLSSGICLGASGTPGENQWKNTINSGIYYNNGPVGVGVALPTETLDVKGTFRVKNSSGNDRILTEGSGGNLYLYNAAGQSALAIGADTGKTYIFRDLVLNGENIADSANVKRIRVPAGGNMEFTNKDGLVGFYIGGTTGNTYIKQDAYVDGNLRVYGDFRLDGVDIQDAGGTNRIRIFDNSFVQIRDADGGPAFTVYGDGTTGFDQKATFNGDIMIKGEDIEDSGGTNRIKIINNGDLRLGSSGGAVALVVDSGADVTVKDDLNVEDWLTAKRIGNFYERVSDWSPRIGKGEGGELSMDCNNGNAEVIFCGAQPSNSAMQVTTRIVGDECRGVGRHVGSSYTELQFRLRVKCFDPSGF